MSHARNIHRSPSLAGAQARPHCPWRGRADLFGRGLSLSFGPGVGNIPVPRLNLPNADFVREREAGYGPVNAGRVGSPGPSYRQGHSLGTDPDPNVRFQISRDPYFGRP